SKTPFEKLKEDLATADKKITLSNQIYDFTESLTFEGVGRDVVIAPKVEGVPQIIRMMYTREGDEWAGFEIKGGHVRFRNIRFDIQATDSSPEKLVTM